MSSVPLKCPLVILALACAPTAAQEPIWSQKYPANKPAARADHCLAYDASRKHVVLFGGVGNDTWVWDGENWIRKNPVSSPRPVRLQAMAYDAAREEVVLFGAGSDSDETWVWNGTNWLLKNPLNRPPGRYSHAVAYDEARRQVVLFGTYLSGNYLDRTFRNDTWVWDGTNWTQKSPANSPPPLRSHAMAYDSARGQVVLFGGTAVLGGGVLNETWVWDGTNWTKKNPANSPPPRFEHAMAYHGGRNQILLFGGAFQERTLNDTWVWDGTNWVQIGATAAPPVARSFHEIAYDSARGQVVLFGGWDGQGFLDDTWVTTPPLRAAVAPVLTTVVNAAAGNGGLLAAGTIVTIFGRGLGPERGTFPVISSLGMVPTEVDEVCAYFDGVAAPILYAQEGQVNTVIPWTLFGRTTVGVEVAYKGSRSPSVRIPLQEAAPAIFALRGNTGPGAIVNQDGSLNSESNGAPIDSIVIVYATGMGQTEPRGIDGALLFSVLPRPVLPVSMLIGNSETEVVYAGAAPSIVSGAMQINCRIPRGLQPGTYPITLRIGRFSSQLGVTIAVK